MAWFFIPAYKDLAMAANDVLFSFSLRVTSSNTKTGPRDELGEKSLFKKENHLLKVKNLSKETYYIITLEIFDAFG